MAGVELQQAGFADFEEGGHRGVEKRFSELGAELVQMDALVQSQAEKQRLLEGLFASDDVCVGG